MATITSVQSNTLNQNTSSPFSVTLGSGVTTGNLLVVCFEEGNNITISGPTGWSQAGSFQGIASNVGAAIWYAIVGSGGVTAGTTSFSFSFTGGTGHNSGATIREWNSSTGWAASPLDVTAGTTGSSTTVATGSTASTTQAQELVVASLAYASTALTESGLTSGYTSGLESTSTSGPNTGREAYQVTSSAGAQSCQMTISSSSQWAAAIATFMPSTGGGGGGSVPTQQAIPRTRVRTRPILTIPASASNVNVNGLVANVSVAAPVGVASVTLAGPGPANVTVAALAGTAIGGANVNGLAASVAVAAPAGVASVSTPGALASVSVAGLAGTPSVSFPGGVSSVLVAAPTGTAAAGTVFTGSVAAVTVAALPGVVSVSVGGQPGQVTVAAPVGFASNGSISMLSVTAGCAFQAYSSISAQATMEFEAGQPVQGGLSTFASDPWISMYPG